MLSIVAFGRSATASDIQLGVLASSIVSHHCRKKRKREVGKMKAHPSQSSRDTSNRDIKEQIIESVPCGTGWEISWAMQRLTLANLCASGLHNNSQDAPKAPCQQLSLESRSAFGKPVSCGSSQHATTTPREHQFYQHILNENKGWITKRNGKPFPFAAGLKAQRNPVFRLQGKR